MRKTMKWLLPAAVVVLLLSCFFVVDQTEFVIQMRLGDPVRTVIDPGLRLKFPWPIDTLVRFDNRLMVLESPEPGERDREYLTEDKQSGIGKNVVVTTYTCWRVRRDTGAVLRFLETMGDRESAEARIGDVVVSELGAALGRNSFAVLVSADPGERGWQEFHDSLRARCTERVEEAYGVEIVDVKIQRLNFPEQNRRNVFDRMRAERETIAARYRSEGEQKATEIRADANQQRDEILAAAVEEAERVRGDADAQAARIYAEAYDQDRDFYRFLRTLEAYEKTLDEGTVAVLSGRSEFLRLLNTPREAGEGDG